MPARGKIGFVSGILHIIFAADSADALEEKKKAP